HERHSGVADGPRPPCWRQASSTQGLQVWPHDICHSADLRRFPELAHRRFLLAITVPKGLKRHIKSDFVAKLEAVSDCLRRIEDADHSTPNLFVLNSKMKCPTGEADNAHCRRCDARRPTLYVDRNPDLMRNLRANLVEIEG